MTGVEFAEGDLQVDATLVAESFGLDPSLIPDMMRAGEITGLHERGVGEDAGRHRLTFSYSNRRVRIVVDEEGRIIERVEDS